MSTRKAPGLALPLALLALALPLGLAACSGSGAGTAAADAAAAHGTPATIVVGATLALSGALDADGAPLEAGYRQEIATVNAAGGIAVDRATDAKAAKAAKGAKRAKRAKEKLTLVVLNNASNPATASAQARQLVQADHAVALLGFATPQLVLPVAAQAESLHVPYLTSLMPVEAFSDGDKTGWTYSWDLCYDEQQQAETAARALTAAPGDKKIALFTDDEPDSAAERPLYAAAFKADGLDLVGDYTFGVGATDFAASLAQARAAGAQLLAGQLSPADGAALARQLRSSGFRPKAAFVATASDSGSDQPLTGLAAETLSAGYWTPGQASPGQLTAIAATLGQRYAGSPDYATAALGYAVAQVLTDALTAAGSASPAAVNAAIGRTDGPTVAGPIKFSLFSHTATIPYHVSPVRP